MNSSHGRLRGFSIVELIVVIVVIAILITVSVVGYSWMRNDAIDAKLEAISTDAIKAVTIKKTKTGTIAITGNPANVDEVRRQYYLTDLGDNIVVTVSGYGWGSGVCNPRLSDGDCNYSGKDKVEVVISGPMYQPQWIVTVKRWNHAERRFNTTYLTND